MKIGLYADTLKRLTLKQSFFLLREKFLKKFIPVKIPSKEKIEKERSVNLLLQNFEKNLSRLKINGEPLWKLGVTSVKHNTEYVNFIRSLLGEYKNTKNIKTLEKLWKTKHDDIEFLYNIQRMHYFKEIEDEIGLDDNQKINIIVSWIDNFPPQKNIAWTGFNCSIRLINWIKILGSVKILNDKRLSNIVVSMLQNTAFIEKNIEHHIPGNHVIFQYFALWLTAFLFGDKHEKKYSNLFENEFENEFLENGLHFERSTHYHLQVLLLGVYFFLINKNYSFSKKFTGKIEKAYYVFEAFKFNEKNLPLIGDNCYNFFHFNLIEDAENLNFLRNYLEIKTGIEKEKLIELENEFLIAGKNGLKVIFDVGGIGMPQNPGHGHADILSINVSFRGTPLFVDPGTKRYSNLPENMVLKRTCSHNTIAIKNEDQAKLWGFFRWAYLPEQPKYKFNFNPDEIIFEGAFSGFKHIGGAEHFRQIIMNDNGMEIFDKISHKNEVEFEQNFILSEYVSFEEEKGKLYLIVNENRFGFTVNSNNDFNLEIIPQAIYKSYDNHVMSNKIRIVYSPTKKLETKIKVDLINE